MVDEGFIKFVFGIENLHKCIKSLETIVAQDFGVKGVHIFWIFSLLDQPEGLSSSEIARMNFINRSLVSREMVKLEKEQIICYRSSSCNAGKYNAKIILTSKGKHIAGELYKMGYEAQNKTRENVSEKELVIFFSVLDRMSENLTKIIALKKGGKAIG